MRKTIKFYHSINIRIIIMLIILFVVMILAVSAVNYKNLHSIYEKNFTDRVLLCNSLIAQIIDSDDVEYYVNMLKDQDRSFKMKQVQFFYEREMLYQLHDEGKEYTELSVMVRMENFRSAMEAFKSAKYWQVIDNLNQLREISHSKYIYVLADTGVTADDGTKLYTYIFDSEDNHSNIAYDYDGLGTVSRGEKAIDDIYLTKKPMDSVMYYNDNDIYGELYYAYAPVIGKNGDVIAILGTDLGVGEMRAEIRKSMLLFSMVLLFFAAAAIFAIYILFGRLITKPLIDLTDTAQRLAEGEVYTLVPHSTLRQKNEIGVLAYAINEMSSVYQSMLKSTENLFDAANSGRLDVRNDASIYKGDIKKVIDQINETLDATTLYLNCSPEGILIMSKDLETHFRNEQYVRYFGDMPASEFIANIFPDARGTERGISRQQFEEILLKGDKRTNIWLNGNCFSVIFREIELSALDENSVLVIVMDITDLMREKENAQAAAKAKSNFLSSMSHEIRTPMNAIIGMTKIAEGTDDILKLKYCLNTIGTSSEHLLSIINDVLDMSKIESGRFELDSAAMNIEKLLMKICSIIIDSMEKKDQRFNVILNKNLHHNYIGDELRLSQVITNLLSNAVKFTPKYGKVTMSVEETEQHGEVSTIRFSIADTGIGIKEDQIGRLFHSFEQADGSITRQFGGTGLGLAISKNIVEKMGGRIWVESEYGKGANFIFEVRLERASYLNTYTYDNNSVSNVKLLVAESDDEIRKYFLRIVGGFGMTPDEAANAEDAIGLIESAYLENDPYDVVFLAYDLRGGNGFDILGRFDGKIDNSVITVITSFLEWHRIESAAQRLNINRYITKPLFPSALLEAINEALEDTPKTLAKRIDSGEEIPDLSGTAILLAEDIELNREIFLELLGETNLSIDFAENGLIAISKFSENYDKYDLIVMDIEMPEMDGYETTRQIRAMDIPKAKTIPIIAMTANVFKEDIERCLASGMNDHLPKPIDEKLVIEKIIKYTAKKPEDL